ncbi:glycosyltransferase [Marinobacter sp. C2H3]|uniref:glycosyltransferase n=1 Tax=Marinobacter sp. C2H3 TaxID=3119003 RepID=UPI00300EC621
MRIVIDMQGAQSSGSRTRGIGRYTFSFVEAVVRNRGEHEVIIALNALFPETIAPIRNALDELLPPDNIRVWHAPPEVAFAHSDNQWRRHSAELVREAFLASLKPDVLHVTSLFEGLGDDAIASISLLCRNVPTSVTLFDLIPFIHRKPYLDNPIVSAWYSEKIESLRRANLWLAISESSRQEGIDHLHLPEEFVVNVSTAADNYFQRVDMATDEISAIRSRYGLERSFIMYTGGTDHRKNIEGLIRAFSNLPPEILSSHQLAIVCSVQKDTQDALEFLALKQGLKKGALVLTGFVPEEDLRALYNLCSLFVFPSWHEGFGLPVLEAMRCGAPVIGANTSSLPEVIGWEKALFNPHVDDSMTAVILRALSDESFRAELIKNAELQAEKFSWDETARRTISAMESLHSAQISNLESKEDKRPRPKLAYVSPLPPERSGIADYSAELLPELSRHYEIEVIVEQDTVEDSWVNANCVVRSVKWLVEHANDYDRVLYHFGNSHMHQHMFDLLAAVPGVVVLHDFFLSNIVFNMESTGFSQGRWVRELYLSHGYRALYKRFHEENVIDVVWEFPCNLSVIQDSRGIIVHSPSSLRLNEYWYGAGCEDWEVIPLARGTDINVDRAEARKALGFGVDDFVVCTFGLIGPAKLNDTLIDAWLASNLAADSKCHLIFVGENHPGDYGNELLKNIREFKGNSTIRITGWADRELFQQYLSSADLAVQLRGLSRGETSAAVLDCMNHGIATIVNANGSMADLDDSAVWKLPDKFTNAQLAEALEVLRSDHTRRQKLGDVAREILLRQHDPRMCANLYRRAIERFYEPIGGSVPALLGGIAQISDDSPREKELFALAEAIAQNFPPRNRQTQILVDISELVRGDSGTGIQRVVRNILGQWLKSPPEGFRVEPVYAKANQPYRYARQFTAEFLGIPKNILRDEVMEYAKGDIFAGLDLQPEFVPEQRAFYQAMRSQGVTVKFIVYDLLCMSIPKYFAPGVADGFARWLEVVIESDGAVCISKSVAHELVDWLHNNFPEGQHSLDVDWFSLGAEFDHLHRSRGLPHGAANALAQFRSRPSLLMVGTIEPRKGHQQVLDAFEYLWSSGVDANLVIVGRRGWLVERLLQRLLSHPEMNIRLFWLEGISDEYLEEVYKACTSLIAASYGEGFGLPLIEAAHHKLPIIARDIPVFREVAGDYAYYFKSDDARELAAVVEGWLSLYRRGEHPSSDNMAWLTWKESADMLMDSILGI